MTNDLVRMTAREIRYRLHDRDVSPQELLDALAARIATVDPSVNALPTLCFERAAERARVQDFSGTPLKGLPIAIKDLIAVAGVRTTWGSKIYEHHVPTHSDLLVERLEAHGAIVYAKSNTPEFGAGANTFNEVFGITESVGHCSIGSRLIGGIGRRLGDGHGLAGDRLRLGGLSSQPGQFLQRGGVPADHWPSAG